MGARLTSLELRPSSACINLPNLVILGETARTYYGYGHPREKSDPLRPAFQGHSRSSEPTRNDWLPVTSCTNVL